MDYAQAISAVNMGKYSWRTSWSGKYIHLFNGVVIVNDNGNQSPYNPTLEDQAATNWDSGDHPPKK